MGRPKDVVESLRRSITSRALTMLRFARRLVGNCPDRRPLTFDHDHRARRSRRGPDLAHGETQHRPTVARDVCERGDARSQSPDARATSGNALGYTRAVTPLHRASLPYKCTYQSHHTVMNESSSTRSIDRARRRAKHRRANHRRGTTDACRVIHASRLQVVARSSATRSETTRRDTKVLPMPLDGDGVRDGARTRAMVRTRGSTDGRRRIVAVAIVSKERRGLGGARIQVCSPCRYAA